MRGVCRRDPLRARPEEEVETETTVHSLEAVHKTELCHSIKCQCEGFWREKASRSVIAKRE